jgi:histidinol-phosphate aminotransferase
MSAVLDLLRQDLRGFAGYPSARRSMATGSIWLNANESPLPCSADPGLRLNRYPEPQPAALQARLADLYGVDPSRLLLGRGSDEGIDLLVRAFCRAGVDAVAIAPPCFGMYAVCARVQGAPLVEVPLCDEARGWRLDAQALVASVGGRGVRLVFLSSPANPTGQALSLEAIADLATLLQGRAVLVLDEAYAEYSEVPSATSLLHRFENLVVLRTLSKAHALAAARLGVVIGDPALVATLRNLQAPYPIASPSAALALAALSPAGVQEATARCAQAVRERDALLPSLRSLPGVRRVYASAGNYLLARFDDADAALTRLLAVGVVVRDMRAMPRLGDALRISLGTPAENAVLVAALSAAEATA